jgi:glycosyltransferase involved in cell wall biosynthesis
VKFSAVAHFFGRPKPTHGVNLSKLGLIAIMKNEAMNLREWIDHYRWQGVDQIFLIDNGSTDGGPNLIEEEIADGFVTLFSRPEPHNQVAHYRAVFQQASVRERVEWLVMADLDEFWFSPGSNLRIAVDTLTDIDLVYTNWVMFGSSGLKEHPSSVRRCLLHRQPKLGSHSDTKWICRTNVIKDARQMLLHKISGVDSARVVSDNDLFRLNHYAIQSLEYFTKIKMTRGDASTPDFDSFRDLDYFKRYDEPASVVDRTLADMLMNVD